MTRSRMKWVVLLAVVTAGVGCVSQTERDKLQTLLRQSEEQVIELKSQLEECRARITALQNAPKVQDPALLNQVEQLKAERDQLAGKIKELEGKIRELAKAPVVLPPEIDTALKQLAAQHSDILDYDAANGMLKLKSDFTFALGSVDINDNAKNTLTQLADILKRVIGEGYEIRIVGHTDNVPIKRADTRAKHPTNWYLSVHRAIAVEGVLQKAGVPPVSMAVSGHGEFRPIAPNGPRGNELNRRVEIYIVPNTYHPAAGVVPPTSEATETPAAAATPEAPAAAPASTPAAETPAAPQTAPQPTEPEPFK